jgi:hypothetical protein
MAGTNFEGFSVSHAAILDGETGAEVADIYGIREGSIEVDTDSFDNTGDDTILSTWSWFNFATLTITSGFVPFSVIALLTGNSITSSGSGDAAQYSLPLWNEKSLNVPPRPVLVRVPSKDADGVPRNMDFILYKVQFEPISFDGPAYKDGLVLNYAGKALMSAKDEKGAAIAGGDRAIGRIVNSARA